MYTRPKRLHFVGNGNVAQPKGSFAVPSTALALENWGEVEFRANKTN